MTTVLDKVYDHVVKDLSDWLYSNSEGETKMAFNEDDDKTLAERVVVEDDTTRLTVSIKRYKKGEKKIQISREMKSGKGWKFAKPGRFTFDEWEAIVAGAEKVQRKLKKDKEE